MPTLRDTRLLQQPYGPMTLAGGPIGKAGPVVLPALILAIRGLPVPLLYRYILSRRQRAGWRFTSARKFTGGGDHRDRLAAWLDAERNGLMPSEQAAATIGGGILATILFPAVAGRLLRPSSAIA